MATLTLEQIKAQSGGQSPAKTGGALTLEQIKSGQTAPADKGFSVSPNIPAVKPGSFGARVQETAKRFGEEGAERIGKTAEEFAKAPIAEKPLQAFRAPMQAVGTAARVAFSPLVVAVQDAAEGISNLPITQRIAMSEKAGKILDRMDDIGVSLGDFAKNNPDLAGDIQDFVDTITLAIGPKVVKTGAKIAAPAVKPVAGAIERAGEAVAERLPRFTSPAEKAADELLKAPVSRGFNADVAATFQKYGIEPPVSAVTGSRAVQAVEAISQSSWIGGAKVAKIVQDAQSGISRVAESLKKNVNAEGMIKPGVTLESVGNDMKAGLAKIKDEFDNAKNKIYDEVEKRIGGQQAVLDETRKALTAMVQELRASVVPTSQREASYFESILNALSTAERRTFTTIKTTRTDIGKAIGRARRSGSDPIESADIGRLKRLYGALSKDLDRTVTASGRGSANALKAADAFYKAGIQKINSFTGRTIKNARNPERIFGSLVKAGDVTTVRELKLLIDAEAFQNVADAFMNSVIQGAIVPLTGKLNPGKLAGLLAKYGEATIRELVGERGLGQLRALLRESIADDLIERATLDGKVQPGRLAQAIEKYDEKTLRQAFGQDFEKLMDVKKMAGAMGRGTKLVEGSPTAEKLMSPINILLGVGGGVGPLITKLGIEWGVTKLFTTAWGRRLITRGGLRKGGKPKAPATEVGEGGSSAVRQANVAPRGTQGQSEGGADIIRYSERAAGAKTPEEARGVIQEAKQAISRETPKKGGKPELLGVAAGVQPDEEGNIEFNPIGAVLGIGAGAMSKEIVQAIKGMKLISLTRAKDKFEKTGSVVLAQNAKGRLVMKDEGDFVVVGMDPGGLVSTDLMGQLPRRTFSSSKEAFAALREVIEKSRRLPKKVIHKDDLAEMRDFTDYVAGAYKPTNAHQLELAASRIAEKYGIKGGKSNKSLAAAFGKVLDDVGFDKAIVRQGGEPLTASDFASEEVYKKYQAMRSKVPANQLAAYDGRFLKTKKFVDERGEKIGEYDVIGADQVARNPGSVSSKNIYDVTGTEELFKNPPKGGGGK